MANGEEYDLSAILNALPPSTNAVMQDGTDMPELFNMLEKDSSQHIGITAIWNARDFSREQKIVATESIVHSLPEIVRKEYRKWLFLNKDRNELPKFILNEYPELNSILTILYKKANDLEEFSAWIESLSGLIHDRFGVMEWAKNEILELELRPAPEVVDLSFQQANEPFETPSVEVPQNLDIEVPDWLKVLITVIDFDNFEASGVNKFEVEIFDTPATELFIKMGSGINAFGSSMQPVQFTGMGVNVREQAECTLDFPPDTQCRLDEAICAADSSQVTQRNVGDVLLSFRRNNDIPQQCYLTIVLNARNFDNSHFQVGRVRGKLPALFTQPAVATSASNTPSEKILQIIEVVGQTNENGD